MIKRATLVSDDMNRRPSELVRPLPVLITIVCFQISIDV